ncbi:LytTR family DNA-binding domain-containing protein [Bradyrhizobium sp. STM 3557]|uniref:LytTR family DNA-binding domain-containing protein n=1 Tax=Bradyrhizobium sp. STM 3557 TaxID=578920 RepID=UPI00388D49EA
MNQIAPAPPRPSDRLFYVAVAVIALGIGLVNALSAAQDALWRGAPYDLGKRLLWETTSIVVILLLVPLLLAGVRRMRRSPGRLGQAGIALATIAIFSALHIAGMVGLRKLLLALAGSGYDFHLSLTTVVYELRKDIVTALLIGSSIWLFDRSRRLETSDVMSLPTSDRAPATPQALWLRDGASRVRVVPGDIVWVASAGNYIEYGMAEGARHLIRGTLASAESQLAGFNIVRIHRTRLANLDRVTALTAKPSGDFDLTFDTGETVQGSRRYRSAVHLHDAASALQ